MDELDRYRITLETRNLEVRLFWVRSNFFLALNTAVAIGFFSLRDDSYSILVAVFGLGCSVLWVSANLGSKFWQIRWEEKLAEIESKQHPTAGLFSESLEEISSLVANSLSRRRGRWFDRAIDAFILRKPSVSRMAIYLSLWFASTWVVLLAWSLVRQSG